MQCQKRGASTSYVDFCVLYSLLKTKFCFYNAQDFKSTPPLPRCTKVMFGASPFTTNFMFDSYLDAVTFQGIDNDALCNTHQRHFAARRHRQKKKLFILRCIVPVPHRLYLGDLTCLQARAARSRECSCGYQRGLYLGLGTIVCRRLGLCDVIALSGRFPHQ